MNYWLPVFLIGLGTFFYRYSFLSGRKNSNLPKWLQKALEFVPVSVMAALVSLGFFVSDQGVFYLNPPSLAAAAAATGAAIFLKRDLLTILLGLGVYWALQNTMG